MRMLKISIGIVMSLTLISCSDKREPRTETPTTESMQITIDGKKPPLKNPMEISQLNVAFRVACSAGKAVANRDLKFISYELKISSSIKQDKAEGSLNTILTINLEELLKDTSAAPSVAKTTAELADRVQKIYGSYKNIEISTKNSNINSSFEDLRVFDVGKFLRCNVTVKTNDPLVIRLIEQY